MNFKKINFLSALIIKSLILLFVFFSCKKSELTRDYSIEISEVEIEQPEEREAIIRYSVNIVGNPIIRERGIIITVDPEASFFTNRLPDNSSIDQVEKIHHLTLEGGLQFYVRPFVVTSYDTIYGETRSFMTGSYYSEGEGVTDAEGNTYKTVKIGNQEWMAENLRSATFCNGDQLPLVDSLHHTLSLIDKESQLVLNYHSADADKVKLHGYYYAGFTAMDERNICPCGWRIPKFEDIAELVIYLGNDQYVGGKMKSIGILEHGTGNWRYPNAQANNLSGLNIHASGYYNRGSVSFSHINTEAYIVYLNEPISWNFPYDEEPTTFQLSSIQSRIYVNYGIIGTNSSFVSIRCIKN